MEKMLQSVDNLRPAHNAECAVFLTVDHTGYGQRSLNVVPTRKLPECRGVRHGQLSVELFWLDCSARHQQLVGPTRLSTLGTTRIYAGVSLRRTSDTVLFTLPTTLCLPSSFRGRTFFGQIFEAGSARNGTGF